jgi:hypothetical protein
VSKLKSWPPIARDILLDAARYYYQQMHEPWPVPDVLMEQAIEWVNKQLEERQPEIYEEASARWIDRWERGQLDAEMPSLIQDTYQRMRRAERTGIPSAKKKSTAQLDAEISQILAGDRK